MNERRACFTEFVEFAPVVTLLLIITLVRALV